jgi:hypothetical protein
VNDSPRKYLIELMSLHHHLETVCEIWITATRLGELAAAERAYQDVSRTLQRMKELRKSMLCGDI